MSRWRRRGTFWAENAIFDMKALKAPDVLVYCLLCRQAEGGDGRSKQSTTLIAMRARLSARSVQASVKTLEKFRIVEVRPGGGRGKLNVYRVLPSSQWLRETPQEVPGKNPAGSGLETPQQVHPEGDTALRDRDPEIAGALSKQPRPAWEERQALEAEYWERYPHLSAEKVSRLADQHLRWRADTPYWYDAEMGETLWALLESRGVVTTDEAVEAGGVQTGSGVSQAPDSGRCPSGFPAHP